MRRYHPDTMSEHSSIEWTDSTWNPVRGCTKVSPGCAHCYAETFAERFRGVPGHPYEHGFDPRLVPEKLAEPLRWQLPRMVFVNSMSDLFHEAVPDEYIVRVARVMAAARWHTFQVLTKRSERMRDLLQSRLEFASKARNVWWGVSVENQKHGLPRIQHVRDAPACVRFLSIEPLLEDLGPLNLTSIGWVIVGGESGPGADQSDQNGCEVSASSASALGCPSFSNSGAARTRRSQVANLTAARTTSCPSGRCGNPSRATSGTQWPCSSPFLSLHSEPAADDRVVDGRPHAR
jgi:protein gp37